jgi:hypothetical protein
VLTFVRLDQPLLAEELLNRLRSARYPPEAGRYSPRWCAPRRARCSTSATCRTPGWAPSTCAPSSACWCTRAIGRLELLPGTPPDWVAGRGLAIDRLPTAFGALSMSAQQDDGTLHADSLLRTLSPSHGRWMSAGRRGIRPRTVTVDGKLAQRLRRRRHPPAARRFTNWWPSGRSHSAAASAPVRGTSTARTKPGVHLVGVA